MKEKIILRIFFKKKLASLTVERKKEASAAALKKLYEISCDFPSVLSFMSLPDEIDLHQFNNLIIKKLLLPKIFKDELKIYHVENLDQLDTHPKWGIREPSEKDREEKVPLEKVSMVLIPALAFDNKKNRLGRGLGLYDRLLGKMREKTKKIGIGFKEQLSLQELPKETHDIAMDEILLF